MKTYLSNYRFWIILVSVFGLGFIHNSRLFSLNISPFLAAGLSRYTFERILFLAITIFSGYAIGKKTGIAFAVTTLALMLPNAFFLATSRTDATVETIEVTVTGLLVIFLFDMHRRDIDQLKSHEKRIIDLSQQLVSAYEIERERIGQELHDSVGQSLTVASLSVQHLKNLPPGELVQEMEEAASLIDEAARDVRDISHLLKPPFLEDAGLFQALENYFEWLRSRGALEVDFKRTGAAVRFPKILEMVVFRIVQEALTNVSRHSGVKEAMVSVSHLGNRLVLEIADKGAGFNNSDLSGRSLGLRGIRERAELLGGTLIIDSAPGKGTRIKADFPIQFEDM